MDLSAASGDTGCKCNAFTGQGESERRLSMKKNSGGNNKEDGKMDDDHDNDGAPIAGPWIQDRIALDGVPCFRFC